MILAPKIALVGVIRHGGGTGLGQGSADVGGHEHDGGRETVFGPVRGGRHVVGAGQVGAKGANRRSQDRKVTKPSAEARRRERTSPLRAVAAARSS